MTTTQKAKRGTKRNKMDWDYNHSLRNFVSLTDHSSIGFLYDFNNNINHFPSNSAGEILTGDNHNHPHHDAHVGILANYENNHLQHLHGNNDQKKKKLRDDQLDLLERSFQEEIKLDPDRKLRLSRELGLQPRQIAVWFQNRRARWKAKQLERLYDILKLEFDAVSREKLMLQEEVLRLKAMVGDAMSAEKQASAAGQTEISGEETAESTRHCNKVLRCSAVADLMMNGNGANDHESYGAAAVMNSYWDFGFPSYPQ